MFHGTRHRVHKTLAFFRRSPADYSNDARHRKLGDLALPRAWSPSEGMRSMLLPRATSRRRKKGSSSYDPALPQSSNLGQMIPRALAPLLKDVWLPSSLRSARTRLQQGPCCRYHSMTN